MSESDEKKVLFSNTSKMTEKETGVFVGYMGNKLAWKASTVILVICLVLGGVLIPFVQFLGIGIIGIGIVVGVPLCRYLMREAVKKQNEQIFDGKKYIVKLEFCQEEFSTMVEEAEDSREFHALEKSTYGYGSIAKIVKYLDYAIIIAKNNTALVFDPKGMTKGTFQELVEFLLKQDIKIVEQRAKRK